MKPELNIQFVLPQNDYHQAASVENDSLVPEQVIPESPTLESPSEIDIKAFVEKFIPESEYASFALNPETGESLPVIDINKIKELLQPDRYLDGVRISRKKILICLFDKHKNDRVLTLEQVEKNDYRPKPLFYFPKSVDEATDIISIADAEFQIPLWEVTNKMVLAERSNVLPTQDGEDMSMFEARVALTLFHPDYADGRRNPRDGKLYLKNPDYDPTDINSLKRLPFNRNLIRKYGLMLQKLGTGESRSMREGITDECPNLLQSGSLKLADVREFTITKEGEVNSAFESKTVGDNAYVMLRGVNQYVGRRFAGSSVHLFGDSKALVFDEQDGYKKLQAFFTIVDKADASDVYVGSNGNKIPRANADKTNLVEIKYPVDKTDVVTEQKREEVAKKIVISIESLLKIAAESEALVRDELVVEDSELQAKIQEVRSLLLSQAERAIVAFAASTDALQLEEALTSSEISARTFVALMQSGGVEKMVKHPLDSVPSSKLSENQREQMRLLLRTNYEAAYPHQRDTSFREEVARSLESAFSRSGTDFYILKDGEQIVSFNRFDTHADAENSRTVLYFGSFNADPKYRGVGGVMLEHTIQEKLQTCDVMQAHCDPASDISKKYIEDGFIATNTETVAGNFSFEIWRSRDSSEQLVTKEMPVSDLIAVVDTSQRPEDHFFVRRVEPEDSFPELDSGLGYALTRYFTVQGVTYAAFEIPPADLYNRFTPARNKSSTQIKALSKAA